MPSKRGRRKQSTTGKKLPEYDDETGLRGWLQNVLTQLCGEFDRPTEEHIFAGDPEALPRYRQRIAHPMWLAEVEKRAKAVYTSIDEFDMDLQLICDNCVEYNGASSKWAAYANNLRADVQARLVIVRSTFTALEAAHPTEAASLRSSAEERIAQHPLQQRAVVQPALAVPQGVVSRSPPREDREGKPPQLPYLLRAHLLAEDAARPVKLVKRVRNVDDIVAMYQSRLRQFSNNQTEEEAQSYSNFLHDLCAFINTNPEQLMFPAEWDEHQATADPDGDDVTSLYGVDLLLRLLAKLPDILPDTLCAAARTAVYLAAEELLLFLSLNWHVFLKQPEA